MSKRSFTVNDLPQAERPRERMQKLGAEALSAQELLALILGRGVSGESVMVTAQKLLSEFGSLKNISEASLEELQSIKGIGTAKATQIKACFEVARRTDKDFDIEEEGIKVRSAEDVYKLLKGKISKHSKEHFVVVSLDSRDKVLGADVVSVGTLNENLVHPRETFELAIRRRAASIVIAHNHPSGDVEPSQADIDVTKKLKHAGSIMGIKVVDHVIIGNGNWNSFQV